MRLKFISGGVEMGDRTGRSDGQGERGRNHSEEELRDLPVAEQLFQSLEARAVPREEWDAKISAAIADFEGVAEALITQSNRVSAYRRERSGQGQQHSEYSYDRRRTRNSGRDSQQKARRPAKEPTMSISYRASGDIQLLKILIQAKLSKQYGIQVVRADGLDFSVAPAASSVESTLQAVGRLVAEANRHVSDGFAQRDLVAQEAREAEETKWESQLTPEFWRGFVIGLAAGATIRNETVDIALLQYVANRYLEPFGASVIHDSDGIRFVSGSLGDEQFAPLRGRLAELAQILPAEILERAHGVDLNGGDFDPIPILSGLDDAPFRAQLIEALRSRVSRLGMPPYQLADQASLTIPLREVMLSQSRKNRPTLARWFLLHFSSFWNEDEMALRFDIADQDRFLQVMSDVGIEMQAEMRDEVVALPILEKDEGPQPTTGIAVTTEAASEQTWMTAEVADDRETQSSDVAKGEINWELISPRHPITIELIARLKRQVANGQTSVLLSDGDLLEPLSYPWLIDRGFSAQGSRGTGNGVLAGAPSGWEISLIQGASYALRFRATDGMNTASLQALVLFIENDLIKAGRLRAAEGTLASDTSASPPLEADPIAGELGSQVREILEGLISGRGYTEWPMHEPSAIARALIAALRQIVPNYDARYGGEQRTHHLAGLNVGINGYGNVVWANMTTPYVEGQMAAQFQSITAELIDFFGSALTNFLENNEAYGELARSLQAAGSSSTIQLNTPLGLSLQKWAEARADQDFLDGAIRQLGSMTVQVSYHSDDVSVSNGPDGVPEPAAPGAVLAFLRSVVK